MRKFWNWVRDSDEERTLYLNGVISEETWWGDEVTPKVLNCWQVQATLRCGLIPLEVMCSQPLRFITC